jgi:hypothetical protein
VNCKSGGPTRYREKAALAALQEQRAIVNKVTVYRFKKYDISTDNNTESRRWATREAIKRIGGEVLEDTAVEVDAAVLGAEIEGMTERNFNPHPRTGFQGQVEVAPRRY